MLTIFLADLEAFWSDRGRRVCAVCGKDFDDYGDDSAAEVPLLLWRRDGREMLVLCFEPCAASRISQAPDRRPAAEVLTQHFPAR